MGAGCLHMRGQLLDTMMKLSYLKIFGIWTIAALFTSTQLYLKSLQAGGDDSWAKLFFVQFIVWNIWACFTPFIFFLGRRFRIDRQSYYRGVAVHTFFAVLMVLLYLAGYSLVWNWIGVQTISWEGFQRYFTIFFLNLFHWHFFIYMAIIGYAHAINYYQEYKHKQFESIQLEKELVSSELSTIKAQLAPHFLFNTLNNVISSIQQGKSEVASGMLLKLSQFLRMTLNESKHRSLPLQTELEYTRKYLEIEQYRNQELNVFFDVHPDLLTYMVPGFILQPIVENAIKHGIAKKQDASRIEIGADLENEQLKLWVYNEGPRLSLTSINSQEGIGLNNTQKRLEKLFGKNAKVEMLSVNDGVITEIFIPIRSAA